MKQPTIQKLLRTLQPALAQQRKALVEQQEAYAACIRDIDELLKRIDRALGVPRFKYREQAIINAIGFGKLSTRAIANALNIEMAHSFQDTLTLLSRFNILLNDADGWSVAPEFSHMIGREMVHSSRWAYFERLEPRKESLSIMAARADAGQPVFEQRRAVAQ